MYKTIYRICVIGPSSAGKTTWLKRWSIGKYIEVPPREDMNIYTMSIPTNKGRIRIIMYDVSDGFGYMMCSNIDLCIVMIDISDIESVTESILYRDMFSNRYPNIPLITIGNKIDLGISTYNMKYMCSCKTGENIDSIYKSILDMMVGEDIEIRRSCYII